MNKSTSSVFVGQLAMESLFTGSKSEAIYPVLRTDDGRMFRLHYKGDESLNEKSLAAYAGKSVSVIGAADRLRGHWRIVLTGEKISSLIEVIASPAAEPGGTEESTP